MTDRLVRGLRLIESGHYHGLGDVWLKKTGGEAADEIERLRAKRLDFAKEVERLTNGVKKIQEYLEEDRTGDALFVCDALLAR